MLHTRILGTLLLVIGLGGAACSGKADAVTPARPATQITGKVKGTTLDVKSAVFIYRAKADDLTLVLGSTPDLCAALRAAALPKGATVMFATIKQGGPLRDAPFGQADYPVPRGADRGTRYTKRAQVMQLEATCRPTWRVTATAGSIRLDTPTVKVGGTAAGTLDLTLEGGDRIRGRFTATHCPAEDEPRGCR